MIHSAAVPLSGVRGVRRSALWVLCAGEVRELNAWLDEANWRRVTGCAAMMGVGAALFGFSAGWWRAPLMGCYVAFKLPFLIVLTLLVNGLINGMFGLLLGSGLAFRQTLLACLMSFAIFGLIVGSLAPVVLFAAWNMEPPGAPGAALRHAVHLLVQTGVIAFAGVVANVKLFGVLRARCRDVRIAAWTLFGWLAGNLFVGAQLSWNLRPFFGSPSLPVRFLRDDPFDGTFYEAVWRSAGRLAGEAGLGMGAVVVVCIAAAVVAGLLLSVGVRRN